MTTDQELVRNNKVHWDTVAQNFDKNPWGILHMKLSRKLLPHILKAAPFDKGFSEVMDFGCGNGFNSSLLAIDTKSILGVDISNGMVDEYNRNVEKWGFNKISSTKGKLKAVRADITDKESGIPPELQGRQFDIIFCCMTYHHLPSIVDTTRALADFLKPGGTLLVVDWVKPEIMLELSEDQQSLIKVPGLSKQEMRSAFEAAGLTFRSYEAVVTMDDSVEDKQIYNTAFLACADKEEMSSSF
uniref:Hexaprenyldihydroxybenzoate methyltransferase n=1 Tax=Moniliophthora roreri TaxID=221103 RepID=A0A0W0FWP2_MONRR